MAALSTRLAAVSTRLAKDSSRQNRYILVFTVATVFYLPISFVTVRYSPSGFNMFLSTPD